jgi:hypothetical protein
MISFSLWKTWNVGNVDWMMLSRKFNDLVSPVHPNHNKSHPDSRILVTQIPNNQNKFCCDKYKILRLQSLTILKNGRQFVYGVTLWCVREIFNIFG